MNRVLEEMLRRLGYVLVPITRLATHAHAEHLRRTLELLEIDCVLDVGASRGQYRDVLRNLAGYSGWVVSFEPIPANVRHLQARARSDPKWLIRDCALGAEQGEATFNVAASDTFSSFLEPDHTATTRFERDNRVASRIPVQVRTVDAVLPSIRSHTGAANIFLKLDTQGFDLAVVAGAGGSLDEIRGVQAEAALKPLYQGGPTLPMVISRLEEKGFEVSGLFHNNPRHFPRLFEVECFMVNSQFLK